MARKRMIDPNIWTSEDVSKLTIFERLLLIGMFSNADDHGKGRANSSYLRSTIFPYDEISSLEIEIALTNVLSKTNLMLYEIDGSSYYKFSNWTKWQKVEKPQPSKIPDPETLYSKAINKFPELSGNGSGNGQGQREVNIREVNIIKENIKEKNIVAAAENSFEKKYLECFGKMINEVVLGDIDYYLASNVDAALIAETMCDAARANARTWNYSKKILETCIRDKVLTLEKYKARREEHERAVASAKKKCAATKKQEIPQHVNFEQRQYTDDALNNFFSNVPKKEQT